MKITISPSCSFVVLLLLFVSSFCFCFYFSFCFGALFFFSYLYCFLCSVCFLTHLLYFAPTQAPPCNGAAISEYRLEWGAAEGSMQVCYTGAALSHEMRGLLPATNYFCRVQVRNTIIHLLSAKILNV